MTDGYGTVNKLYNSGTISASATSTDTTTAFLTAIAIDDKSGTLSYINNSGTISATACAATCGLASTIWTTPAVETHTAA